MKSACLLILASLALCYVTVSDGQGISAEDDTERGTTIDDIILQRAESLLLRSILNKLQEENGQNDALFSRSEWVTKRQHPGKRFSEEKRQHPGRREEEDEEEQQDVQRRQHPGKREDEMRMQKRQHPGRRAAAGRLSDTPLALLSELSKRQHPGRRYLVLHSKRQHPGKRSLEEEEEEGGDSDWTADRDDEELSELESRQQHPGKRLWDNSIPELSTDSPCDVLDPDTCRKTSLLLDFLDNLKSHGEEKRQHPGKRFAPEEDIEGGE